MKSIEKRLAARLLKAGDLTDSDLEKALKLYKKPQPFEELLLEEKMVTPQAITKAFAEINGFDFVDLRKVNPANDALDRLKPSDAWKLEALPLEFEGDSLVVLMSDCTNVFAHDELKILTGSHITLKIAEKQELQKVIRAHYGPHPDPNQDPGDPTTSDYTTIHDDSEISAPSNADLHRSHQRRMREARENDPDLGISQMETRLDQRESRTQNTSTARDISTAIPSQSKGPEHRRKKDKIESDVLDFVLENAMLLRAEQMELRPDEKSVEVRFRVGPSWRPEKPYSIDKHAEVIKDLKKLAGLREDEIPTSDLQYTLKTSRGEAPCRLSIQESINGTRVLVHFPENTPLLSNPLVKVGLPSELSERIVGRLRKKGGGLLFISSPDVRSLQHLYYSLIAMLSQAGNKDVMSIESLQERRIPNVMTAHCPDEESMMMDLENVAQMPPDILGVFMVETTQVLKRVTHLSDRGTTCIAAMVAPDSESSLECFQTANIEKMNLIRGVIGALHVEEAPRQNPKKIEEITDSITLPKWAKEMGVPFYQSLPDDPDPYEGIVYLAEFFQPNKGEDHRLFETLLDREQAIVSACLAGELDPREYSF